MSRLHPTPHPQEAIAASLVDDICSRLAENKPIRQPLPEGGILNIDRLLPFLCVYRRDPARHDKGTGLFVRSEAAFLLAQGDTFQRRGVQQLVRRVAETATRQLDSYLVLEVWAGPDEAIPQVTDPSTGELMLPGPAFRILTREPHRPDGAVATLELALQGIKVHRQPAEVEIERVPRIHPPGMWQLISAAEAERIGCHVLGLEIRPIYRDLESGELYHRIHRALARNLARGMKKAFFAFALNRTTVRPRHYLSLGRKALPRQVFAVDRQLAEISQKFKFLLLVTPINSERSWQQFHASGFEKTPRFHYRPLGEDPLLLKRRLMRVATEQVDDPTLSHVLRQTQDELDRQITMLSDIDTSRFLPGSLQVFGGVEPPLLAAAQKILRHVPVTSDGDNGSGDSIGAKAFARHAAREIEYYRDRHPGFAAEAIVRADMYSGLLSTGGNLLIGRGVHVPVRRVEALLQHEVGTHLVTYYNGKSQPLRLLQVGLAGYDGLQEGLAVLSEYLVGGLTARRMRTLAARVVATDCLTGGATFIETFRVLVDTHGFDPRSAYTITVRVFRGGGLTKDAVYLRGLMDILNYLADGGELDPLFVGKIAAEHISLIHELLFRGALRPATLRPRWLDDPQCQGRLDAIRRGRTLLEIIDQLAHPSSHGADHQPAQGKIPISE